jgi:hypothetical protein
MSVWGVAEGRWGWAIGAGAMAMVSFLIAPAALPPRFGLDHEFSIESNEFLDTISIVCARKSICIANPYFIPDPVALEILDRGEAARGRRADHGIGYPQR